jgi:hypothetical protein
MGYPTCFGCVHGTGACQERERVKGHVKGIAVTSLKWKCKYRRPIYQSGAAVWVNLFIGMEDQGHSWGREEQLFAEFPGVVIRLKGSKAVIFVEPGCQSDCENYDFEPQKNGNGYVKVSLTRARRRDAIREYVCIGCERIVRLNGHEDYCRYQPVEERPKQEYMF